MLKDIVICVMYTDIQETKTQKIINKGVGMKKAQKTRHHSKWKNIWNSIPIPTFRTVLYSHIIDSLWNVGMGIMSMCLVLSLFSALLCSKYHHSPTYV